MEQTFIKINPADTVVVCLQAQKKGDVIAIATQKRGVGKATTTFNKGAGLASQGKKVF